MRSPDQLTEQKLQIVQWVAKGLRYGQIAKQLGTSEQRIKNLIKEYRRAENCETTFHLIAKYLREGLIA